MYSLWKLFEYQLISTYTVGLQLGDTPGLIYGISYIISVFVYCATNPRKRQEKLTWLKQALLAVFLLFFMIVTKNVPQIFFPFFVLSEFAMVCLLIYLGCNFNRRNSIYYGMRAYVLGEFAASFEWQIYYYAVNNQGVKVSFISQFLYMLIIFGSIYVIAFFIEKHLNRDDVHLHIERQELLASMTIGFLIYVFSNFSYLEIKSPFTAIDRYGLFLVRTLVDSAGILILSFYHMMLKETHARYEATQMETILRMQYSNYQISRETMDLVNQKYHDMKHVLAVLRNQTDEDKHQYLDQIEQEIKVFENTSHTGNEALDAIITSKRIMCQKDSIKMTVVANGEEISFMNVMDISTLFGNALDNAIEACEKIENQNERLIHLTVSRDKGFLRITCENRFSGELDIKNGMPRSSKNDNRYHGFGVKSIKNIVEKYHGSTTMSSDDGWFRLRILIPI